MLPEKTPEVASYDFKSLLPYVAPVLILLGVTRIIFFYSFFSFDVIKFLEFSEILTSFFDAVVIGVFVFIFLVATFTSFLLDAETVETTSPITKEQKNLFGSPQSRKKIKTAATVILGTFLLGIINGLFTKKTPETFTYSLYSSSLIGTTGIIIGGYLIFNNRRVKWERKLFVLLVALVNISIVFIMLTNYQKYLSIRYGKRNKDIKVSLENKTLPTDSFYYYIGNTRNYVFMYDEKKRRTDVFPMSRVSDIKFAHCCSVTANMK